MIVDNENWPDEYPPADLHGEVFRFLGRNDLPDALWGAFSETRLTKIALAEGVVHAWSLAEFPEDCLTRGQWVRMFEAAGFTIDGKPAERPTGTVVLYRGVQTGFDDDEFDFAGAYGRMSWTTDVEQARWFASRFGGSGVVLRHEFDWSDVLAIPGEAGRASEHEAIVRNADGNAVTEFEFIAPAKD